MEPYMEENTMIKINKKRFLVTLLILLTIGTITLFTTGFVVGHRMAYAKSDTYDDLRAFTRALEIIRSNMWRSRTPRSSSRGPSAHGLQPRSPFVLYVRARVQGDQHDIKASSRAWGSRSASRTSSSRSFRPSRTRRPTGPGSPPATRS